MEALKTNKTKFILTGALLPFVLVTTLFFHVGNPQ